MSSPIVQPEGAKRSENKANQKEYDPAEFEIRKRLPPGLPRRSCDVYVTNKTAFKAQLNHCLELLRNSDSSVSSVYLHSLGAAIPRAINLALQVEQAYLPNQLKIETQTATVELTDDFEPFRRGGDRSASSAKRNNSAMLFTLRELVRWLGISPFELLINLTCLLLFSVLFLLKAESSILEASSWWVIFAPVLAADALNAYFCTIVFIRMYIEGHYKAAVLRSIWSLFLIVCLTAFKCMLCKNLVGAKEFSPSETLTPVFVILQFFMLRACMAH